MASMGSSAIQDIARPIPSPYEAYEAFVRLFRGQATRDVVQRLTSATGVHCLPLG
jgi:hypothetical protein